MYWYCCFLLPAKGPNDRQGTTGSGLVMLIVDGDLVLITLALDTTDATVNLLGSMNLSHCWGLAPNDIVTA